MKKISLLLFGFSMHLLPAQDLIIPTFLEKWENSKTYLMAIAETMPSEKYDFKPTEKQMEFQEQLLHIKNNMDWLSHAYFKSDTTATSIKNTSKVSKEEIIQSLKLSFDKVSAIIQNTQPTVLSEKVDFFAGEKTKLQILNLLQDHISHHRGQLIVYLNLNGISPPKYIGW